MKHSITIFALAVALTASASARADEARLLGKDDQAVILKADVKRDVRVRTQRPACVILDMQCDLHAISQHHALRL